MMSGVTSQCSIAKFAGPSEPGHDLVDDEQHVVLVADLADPLEVAVVWIRAGVGGTGDRLRDERRDRLRPLVLDEPLKVVCTSFNAAGVPAVPVAALTAVRRRALGAFGKFANSGSIFVFRAGNPDTAIAPAVLPW